MERFTKPLSRLDYFLSWIAFLVIVSIPLIIFFRPELDSMMASEEYLITPLRVVLMIIGLVARVNLDYRRMLDIYGHRFSEQDIFISILTLVVLLLIFSFFQSPIFFVIEVVYSLFLLFKKGHKSH